MTTRCVFEFKEDLEDVSNQEIGDDDDTGDMSDQINTDDEWI